MTEKFTLDNVSYEIDALPQTGKELVMSLKHTQATLLDLSNQLALLTKAKNAYIADLNMEIVEGSTGIDLGSMFAGDD